MRGFQSLIALTALYLSGCATQTTPPQTSLPTTRPTVAKIPLITPLPVAEMPPVVAKPQYRASGTLHVAENATNPSLVREGVREWLDAHSSEFKPAHRDAILRRMQVESGFQPCVRNGRYHYLLQWADNRLRNLRVNAGVRPGQCPSWIAQMRHMEWELSHFTQYAVFLRAPSYRTFTVNYLGGHM